MTFHSPKISWYTYTIHTSYTNKYIVRRSYKVCAHYEKKYFLLDEFCKLFILECIAFSTDTMHIFYMYMYIENICSSNIVVEETTLSKMKSITRLIQPKNFFFNSVRL